MSGAHDHDHDCAEAHHHGHGHGHHHGHGHVHAPASFGMAFAVGIALNCLFVAIELTYGFLSGSLALLADAGHNMSDILGLVIAWGAIILGQRAPTRRFTYGLRGSSILAALTNGGVLMLASGAIALEALQRLADPRPVAGTTVMVVAAIGILVNGATAMLFMSGRKHDINIRGAFLHMLADAAVSAGVIVAGLLIRATGWQWLDPLTSLIIVAVIVGGAWGLLKESLAMSLNAVPASIDPIAVEQALAALQGVGAVHHLHIWPMSTTETAMTAHLVMPDGGADDNFLCMVSTRMREDFAIGHCTVQVERDAEICADRGCGSH